MVEASKYTSNHAVFLYCNSCHSEAGIIVVCTVSISICDDWIITYGAPFLHSDAEFLAFDWSLRPCANEHNMLAQHHPHCWEGVG